MLGLILCAAALPMIAQDNDSVRSAMELKKLSFDELLNTEVTSVSRRPERLIESASAVQVITQDDIRRSGATRLPEVLRLASNLHVAQIDSSNWAISARGFNNALANKLLVMIDGRAVYSPLFAGVFWDVQDTLLADIERVEVISGPGATAWGANAVNGVINVITKSAKETQGLYVEAGGGVELNGFGGLRYGGSLATNLHFRAYGKYFDRDSTMFMTGADAGNDWHIGQGGLRMDYDPTENDLITVQGDFYNGRIGRLLPGDLVVKGGNALARWSHTLSDSSDFRLQLYFDRACRRVPGQYDDVIDTYDVDFQYHLFAGERHDVVWGLGYRLIDDNFENSAGIALLPPNWTLQTFTAFLQDEIALIENKLSLTIGSKVEHNDYTGFEYQPGVRLAWKANEHHTVWGAISRAVRTPSRVDRDLFIPNAPPFVIAGGPNFQSEELTAFELGYRARPIERTSVSLALFYNNYENIRSVEPGPPITLANGNEGESYGAELTVDYQVTDHCRVWAGYTHLQVSVRREAGSGDATGGTGEWNDPKHQFFLRTAFDLPGNVELGGALRYISQTSNQAVPDYAELDVRLAWRPKPNLEFSIVGQNLIHDRHAEFGALATRQEVQRTIFGKVTWSF